MQAISVKKLEDLGEHWKRFDVIGIDEGQFYSDVVSFAEEAANLGKIVIISALDGTYLRTGFEHIMTLIPMAEKVKKLSAVCRTCKRNAHFTFRISESESLELVGGTDVYKPLCRACFLFESAKMHRETDPTKYNSAKKPT